jgi:rRNA-processing protein FCF1
MRKSKLYLETPVWNFCFAEDAPEKQAATLQFFERVKQDTYDIFISDVVFQEFDQAAEEKRELLYRLIADYQPTELKISAAVVQLADQYLVHQVLPATAEADSKHAAVATVYELEALISWNLKHLANLKQREKINGVNLTQGYAKKLELLTPLEVINDD